MFLASILAALLCSYLAAADVVFVSTYYGSNDPSHLHFDSPESDSLFRRQVYYNGSKASVSPPTSSDFEKYPKDAKDGCANRIQTLDKGVLSDSGLAACYNIPVFDKKTGVFEAEVRMFNVSHAAGVWKGIRGPDIRLSLQYLNATVQPTEALSGVSSPSGESDLASISPRGALEHLLPRADKPDSTSAPREIKAYTYLGMLNPGVNATEMSTNALANMLLPEITLMAKDPETKMPIMTILSLKDTSFVAGAFQNTKSSGVVQPSAGKGKESTKLPGTTLGIFPIGLIITGSWAVIFIATVGYGTISRIRFQERFKTNMKREEVRNLKTF